MVADTWHMPRRLAYVVSHSYPYSSNGYAVRTHEVAKALAGQGHDVVVFNRPGRPWDIEGFPADAPVRTEQVIDGVRYVFLPTNATPEMSLRDRVRQAETALVDAFEVFRPAVVLAVSNWENAEPAQHAARRMGCPFFYEQRGFWEMSQDADNPEFANSKGRQRSRDYEVRIARAAEAVFTLNAAMRDELVRRGVPARSIHLVSNGVAVPGPVRKGVTRESIGCRSRHLLGYIGSLSEYEGVEDLLPLLKHLRDAGSDVGLLILGSSAPKGLIGSGHETPMEDRLRRLVAELGLTEYVHFIAQKPQAEIGAYYSMCDAIVMPRRRTLVTELVAPLKPYAAAAYSVPVFMPDMPPLDEIAPDIEASLYPEGDMEALAGMLLRALEKGHPATVATLDPRIFWPQRVRPMSQLLMAAYDKVRSGPDIGTVANAPSDSGQGVRFDTATLPRVFLQTRVGHRRIVSVGPGAGLEAEHLVRASRVSLLSSLATGEPGLFLIDWAGLQAAPEPEWEGLWSIDNMRLNRQIMDACRIALDRGWELQVAGPVNRSRAPLFRTVAGVIEERIPEVPEAEIGKQEAAQ
ncbi:glycosyltransferase (plasmid) [Shimia sp. W99]